MSDFLRFFDENCSSMHLEIGYNNVADWGIHVYKRGCGKNGEDIVVVNVSDCDMELCFGEH